MILLAGGKTGTAIGCYPFDSLNVFSYGNIENEWTVH